MNQELNQESSKSVSTLPAAASVSASVLVVDDDGGTQELLAEMLGLMGFNELYTAEDGRMALKVLSELKRPPKFLICDIYMPEMDGFEFMDQLVAQRYSGGIVMMTGVDPEMLRVARNLAVARGLQVLGTFMKPVSLDELSSILKPRS